MPSHPPLRGTVDFAAKIKVTGRLAVCCNAFAMFGVLLFDYQSGGHGEMGSFYHENLIWILLFSGWGLATGIGLLRAWRWARISTMIFSGLLVALGILAVVALLRMPADVSTWQLMILRAVATLFFLSPAALGIWWLVFFRRKEVKTYFQIGR